MDDLIKRADAIDALYKMGKSKTAFGELLAIGWVDIKECLEALPSADVIGQCKGCIYERPHGEWQKCNNIDRHIHEYQCNNCNEYMNYPSNYCPNCGARMKGGSNETNRR